MNFDLFPAHTRDALRKLGFSDNEVRVLGFLFRQKRSTIREVSQATTLAYSSVQLSFSTLAARSLVREISGKDESAFEVCSEEHFLSWVEDQKKSVEKVYDGASNELSSFFRYIQNISWKPDVKYYEGRDGIAELYENMLQTALESDKKIYSWLDIGRIVETLGDFLYTYIEKRRDLGVISHDIVPDTPVNREHEAKKEDREIRFVAHLPIPGEIRIFGDKVAVITFDHERPVGFVFQGGLVTNVFRSIFESQWNQLKD